MSSGDGTTGMVAMAPLCSVWCVISAQLLLSSSPPLSFLKCVLPVKIAAGKTCCIFIRSIRKAEQRKELCTRLVEGLWGRVYVERVWLNDGRCDLVKRSFFVQSAARVPAVVKDYFLLIFVNSFWTSSQEPSSKSTSSLLFCHWQRWGCKVSVEVHEFIVYLTSLGSCDQRQTEIV